MAEKKPRKTKSKEYTVAGVQILFNAAIRRRDENTCATCGTDYEPQASHYNEVGGSSGLRFYPPNVHTQCAGCHINVYHNGSPWAYTRWMMQHVPEFHWMDRVRTHALRYDQSVLETIASYCKADRLEDLTIFVEMLYLRAGVEGPEKMIEEADAKLSDEELILRYRTGAREGPVFASEAEERENILET